MKKMNGIVIYGSTLLLSDKHPNILQFCHSHEGPFADVARQYKALFNDLPYKVVTVFLTGEQRVDVAEMVGGEVIFLENSTCSVKGLKLRQIRQLKSLDSRYQFDFAITHRFKPLYIASHLRNIPIISVHHAYGDFNRFTRRWHVQKYKKRIRLLGVSDSVRDDVRKSLPRISEAYIQTLYNRVNPDALSRELFSRQKAREQLAISDNTFVFGNVGRLHPDKDQSTLLKAFAEVHAAVPDSLLVIMGEGRLEHELKREAVSMGIHEHVRFTGRIPDARKLFRAFDCFVLSSDHEPFGMVLLEAMMAGVPVIASNCGGAPEVTGTLGGLFTMGDVKALAGQMLNVCQFSSAKRSALAQAMSERVDTHFSDQAARKAFWNIPFVRDIVSNDGSF